MYLEVEKAGLRNAQAFRNEALKKHFERLQASTTEVKEWDTEDGANEAKAEMFKIDNAIEEVDG